MAMGVCLASIGTAAQAPRSAPGYLYYSRDYGFRVMLPSRNPQVTQQEKATLFASSGRGDPYDLRVVVYQLDAVTAHQDFAEYFRAFQGGMKQNGTSMTGCQQGLVSNAPAERCVVSDVDGIGLMLLVRRGGVSYYVAGLQDRSRADDAQISAAVGSFLLLPELEPFSFVEHGFRANFPAHPRVTRASEGNGVIVQAFAAADRYMTMVSIDDLTPAQRALDAPHLFAGLERQDQIALQQVHLRLSECAPVGFLGGLPAHYCTYDDDQNTGKLLLVRHGDKIYSVLAHQPRGSGSDAELEQFVHSFQFLP
jgi:hypothetical protein